MRRMWAAGAAIVVCLALGGVPVLAQSPSAPAQAAWVTGTQTCTTLDQGTSATVDGVSQVRAQTQSCTHTMTDPRVSGEVTVTLNTDHRGPAGMTFWGTEEIVGTDGTWRGSFSGVVDPQGVVGGFGIYEGTGAYAGWTYINHAYGDGSAPTLDGTIFQGPPPPYGPLPSPASK
jgi:hypothetical protein